MRTRQSNHFHGSHYDAQHSLGPLYFLNPTTQYHLIRAKAPPKPDSGTRGSEQLLPSRSRPSSQAGTQTTDPGPGQEAHGHDDGREDQELSSSSTGRRQEPIPVPETPSFEGGGGGKGEGTGQDRPTTVYPVWRSRDNRKGRHAIVIPKTPGVKEKGAHKKKKQGKDEGGKKEEKEKVVSNEKEGIIVPPATNTLSEVWKGIVKMFVRWPVWDISFDVAVVFTIGSAVWVINGHFVYLPLAAPWTEFPNESELGGGVTACIGATIFELGSILFMLEAVNENRSDCFGWALEEALEDPHGQRLRIDDDHCIHHQHEKRGLLRAAVAASAASLKCPSSSRNDQSSSPADKTMTSSADNGHTDPKSPSSSQRCRRWAWWPTWHELTSHYLREIGFLACLAQMIGATVFWISGFTGLPPIYNTLEGMGPAAVNCLYWLPQVIGGTGFIVSSWLFMLEVQEKWYKPALGILGWHVGVWNLVGAIGFTLCGALGFGSEDSWALEYGSALSTYVGSWAFLIGSLIQWYESLDKYPVSVEPVPSSLRDDEHHDVP